MQPGGQPAGSEGVGLVDEPAALVGESVLSEPGVPAAETAVSSGESAVSAGDPAVGDSIATVGEPIASPGAPGSLTTAPPQPVRNDKPITKAIMPARNLSPPMASSLSTTPL